MTKGLKNLTRYWRRYDTLHYRDHIDDFLVEDTEMAIPYKEDNVQSVVDAFKHIKAQVYKHHDNGEYPLDITVELRCTRGSPIKMAPNFSTDPNECFAHIEFLRSSVTKVRRSETVNALWNTFVNEVCDKWRTLGGRPHWGKDWERITGHVELMKSHPGIDGLVKLRAAQLKDQQIRFLNAKMSTIIDDK